MLVTIHQPEYLPCLVLLGKIAQADTLVLIDNVQFNRSSLQHRAWISNSEGKSHWLTIPFVHKFPQNINQVEIADPKWGAKHEAFVGQTYKDAPYSERLEPIFEIYRERRTKVASVAEASMRFLFDVFGLIPSIVRASELDLAPDLHKGDLLLEICKQLGAKCYLSGRSGSTYLSKETFMFAGVDIAVNSYEPPSYTRSTEPEKSGRISGLDAAMWCEAPELLLK
jgi:hypothetical protein